MKGKFTDTVKATVQGKFSLKFKWVDSGYEVPAHDGKGKGEVGNVQDQNQVGGGSGQG